MPELPEVEAARRAIEDHCVGKKIKKSLVADDPKVVDGVSPADFEAALAGKTIISAHRKGKNMWLQLDSPPFPSFQFGMAGAVYIKGVAITKYKRSAVKDTDEWPSKYSKLFVELDDGLEFSFTDKRRFAKVRLLDNPASVPPISELGPDALLEPMKVDEFWSSLSKKKIGIKALLLDQSFISGIGNWMADEVLYQARIHPQQSASSMSKENCATLLKCINEVIKKAVEVGADSSQFPSNWIFHSREKKPGKAFVDGKKIEFITAGGRTTAYVPELQKLIGNQAMKEASEPSVGATDGKADDDNDELGNEESRKSKVSKGKQTTRAKKPSKKKSSATVEDSDNDAADKSSKNTIRAKKPLKKKLNASNEDSENDAADDDSDNKSSKKASRGKKSLKKKSSASFEDSDNDDEDNDGVNKSSKRTRGAKNPPAKPKRHDENDGENQRKQTRGKKTPAKRKHKESDDNLSNSSESGDDYGDEVAHNGMNTKREKAGASSKKMVASIQNSKQQRKKAK